MSKSRFDVLPDAEPSMIRNRTCGPEHE